MLFANVLVPPVPDKVMDKGGACAPTAPFSVTDPVAPGVIVSALAVTNAAESIVLLNVIAEAVAVEVNVVPIFRTTGALKV